MYFVNSSGAEAGILQENCVNIMAADDLVTEGARSSAAMVLTL